MSGKGLITNLSIREFFRGAVTEAMHNQQVEAEGETVVYLVDLLDRFSQAERLFQDTLERAPHRPLADFYADAVSARSERERERALRQLGDIALFISGLFPAVLQRRLVDVDYYIAMGGNAYGYLSETTAGHGGPATLQRVFQELAGRFVEFMDILCEVGEQTRLKGDDDILRLYEIWLRSGSPRAARRLRELGIEPGRWGVDAGSH
ncbi:MAG: hypothetical protein D6786_09750 [Gammaproteobacteria bacterium]|nr:MAG: hypothetical protein D6786_09750 [Gammaproteobacteria bacterium]